jgi:hypothetical protein
VVSAAEEADPVQRTLRVGRLKTLERLGLAKERQQGVWALDAGAEGKLRQLGERADKFKMMQRALKEAGIDRGAVGMALFERGPRKAPLIGKVVGVGLVDEITDRTWVVLDAVDGRVHYAELGRLGAAEVPNRGMLVALGGDSLEGKPSKYPKLQVLSPVELERHAAYDGPTWLDQAILAKWRPDASTRGFAAEVDSGLDARGRWLVARQLAESAPGGDIVPKSDMMRRLRQSETQRLAEDLSRRLNASYLPVESGRQIAGVYERSITTPTGKLAVIRQQDTFTLAPWRAGLEPYKGRAVTGMIGPTRVTWALDRGQHAAWAGVITRNDPPNQSSPAGQARLLQVSLSKAQTQYERSSSVIACRPVVTHAALPSVKRLQVCRGLPRLLGANDEPHRI